jgi:hypothetical protein
MANSAAEIIGDLWRPPLQKIRRRFPQFVVLLLLNFMSSNPWYCFLLVLCGSPRLFSNQFHIKPSCRRPHTAESLWRASCNSGRTCMNVFEQLNKKPQENSGNACNCATDYWLMLNSAEGLVLWPPKIGVQGDLLEGHGLCFRLQGHPVPRHTKPSSIEDCASTTCDMNSWSTLYCCQDSVCPGSTPGQSSPLGWLTRTLGGDARPGSAMGARLSLGQHKLLPLWKH